MPNCIYGARCLGYVRSAGVWNHSQAKSSRLPEGTKESDVCSLLLSMCLCCWCQQLVVVHGACVCMFLELYAYNKHVPLHDFIESSARGSSFFFWKSDCLGCAVFLPCLFDLACFFLPSYLSNVMYPATLSYSNPCSPSFPAIIIPCMTFDLPERKAEGHNIKYVELLRGKRGTMLIIGLLCRATTCTEH